MRNEEPAGIGINGVLPGNGRCVICVTEIPTNRLMCGQHWGQVPVEHKARLDVAMANWRVNYGDLHDLREAQWACVESIHDVTG